MKTLLQTLFFFLLVTQISFAQWVLLGLSDKSIGDIAVGSSGLFVVTTDSGCVFRSTDNRITWLQIVASGALDIAVAPNGTVYMVKVYGSWWEGGIEQDSLFRSSDGGNIWSNTTPTPLYPTDIEFDMNVAVAPSGTVFCGFLSGVPKWYATGFARSTDGGLSWKLHNAGYDSLGGSAFAFSGNCVITGGYWHNNPPKVQRNTLHSLYRNGDLCMSFDDGQTWFYRDWFQGTRVFALCTNGNILCGFGSLYQSADSGASWLQVSTVAPMDLLSLPFGGVLAGADTLGIILFTDNGDSVRTLNEGLTDLHIHRLVMDGGGFVYAGTDKGVWRRPISEIIPVELTSVIATANGNEIVLTWSSATELNNQGFEVQRKFGTNDFVTVGSVKGNGTTTSHNNYTYVDKLFDAGKYFYRLKQIDFSGKYEYSQTVEVNWSPFTTYKLERNYPNPFNPTTTIGFGIPEKGNVRLSVLNILGEEINVLLNKEMEAGYHSIDFSAGGGSTYGGNAESLPSGVYFYQLRAGSFVETKKMILLR